MRKGKSFLKKLLLPFVNVEALFTICFACFAETGYVPKRLLTTPKSSSNQLADWKNGRESLPMRATMTTTTFSVPWKRKKMSLCLIYPTF